MLLLLYAASEGRIKASQRNSRCVVCVTGDYAHFEVVFGFLQLDRHELSFEAWCIGHQIPEVAALARQFPVFRKENAIILCSFG